MKRKKLTGIILSVAMTATGMSGISAPAYGMEFGDGTETIEQTDTLPDSNNTEEQETEEDNASISNDSEDGFTDGETKFDEAAEDQFSPEMNAEETVDIENAEKGSSNYIAEGTFDNLKWNLDKNGCLTVTGTGGTLSAEDAEMDFILGEGWSEEAKNIKTAVIDVKGVKSTANWFFGCYQLEKIDFKNSDFSNVTDMSDMFSGCQILETLNLDNFNTSKVTDMSHMFSDCGLKSIDVSGLDTSKVTDMSDMFSYCDNLTSLDVSTFNTSRVTDMSMMFYLCENLKSIDLSKFVVSSCKKMDSMIQGCGNLTSITTIPGLTLTVEVPKGIAIEGEPNLYTGLVDWVDSNGNKYTTLPKNKKKSITLTRKRKGDSCTITFNSNGGKVSEKTRNISVGDVFGELPTAKRSGYNFNGWYTGLKNGSKVNAQTKVNKKGKMTLYAHWSKYPNVKTATISVKNCTYNGKQQEPSVTVKIGNKVLKENRDFTVKYSNNMDAGKGTVNIKGKGNYCGSVTKKFTIKPLNINGQVYVQLDKDSYTWDGTNKKPEFEVYVARTLPGSTVFRLERRKDYTYKYKNYREPGTASLIITGKGNYTGTKTVSYKIDKQKQPATVKPAFLEEIYKENKVYSVSVSGKKEGAKVVYTSNNKKVACIDKYNRIVLKGPGSATISVSIQETKHYKTTTIKIPVEALKKQSIKVGISTEIGYTEAQIPINATANGKLTYESLTPDIVAVDKESGMIKCKKTGTAKIKITAEATGVYAKTTKTFTFTITKGTPVITCETEITKNVSDLPFNLGASTGAEKVTLKYTSSDTNIAEVDSEGTVKLKAWEDNTSIKEVKITIASEATKYYESTTAAITLNIRKFPPDEIYLKQNTDFTCTLCSAAMMLRRKAFLNASNNWNDITENSIESAAWTDDVGLNASFTYDGMTVYSGVLSGNTSDEKKETLIAMLNSHPEGIVIYNLNIRHAVLLTDYTDGVFYCSDPDSNPNRAKGRIPITETLIAERCKTTNQDLIINSLGKCWYIR